jgi:hypothetical protein
MDPMMGDCMCGSDPSVPSPNLKLNPIKPRSISFEFTVPPVSGSAKRLGPSGLLDPSHCLGIIEPISPKKVLFPDSDHPSYSNSFSGLQSVRDGARQPKKGEECSSLVAKVGTPRMRYMNPRLMADGNYKSVLESQVSHFERKMESRMDSYFEDTMPPTTPSNIPLDFLHVSNTFIHD